MALIRVRLPVAALGFTLLVNMAWMGLLGYGIVELIETLAGLVSDFGSLAMLAG